MNVLVVRPSSLGDIVYALATVTDIRAARPEAKIDWVAEPAFVGVTALCPDIRRVIPFALRAWRTEAFRPQTWREVSVFRRALRSVHYDAILDLQEQVKGALIARTARGVRHGFDRASIREPVATLFDDVHHHISQDIHFVERCRQLAASALRYETHGPPRWNLQTPTPATAIPDRPFVVALHATSRGDKLWPEVKWRSVLEAWDRAGFAIVIPWGSADEKARSERLARDIASAQVPPRVEVQELAAIIDRAALAIGVDTGLTHLAAALGTPTVALFTVTDPSLAGVACAGPHARDLGGLGSVPSVEDVLGAAGTLLRTRQC
jgi:heptosyltransferase-1